MEYSTLLATSVALLVGGFVAGYWLSRRPLNQRASEERRQNNAARSQFERVTAANEERQRIYRDLHDDIGAKMLTLIHSLENDAHADLARAVMQDLRDIVSRSAQSDELPDPHLDDGQALHLFRIVREAVTNALRHAHPHRIGIRSRQNGGDLVLDVTDDGPGPKLAQTGAGTTAMRRRAEELHGSIHWDAGTEGGTKVLLRFPLPQVS